MSKSKFEGTWKLDSTENFDEYMKAIGVGYALRKMAALAKPSTFISKKDDEWTIKTVATFKSTEIAFKLGQEFDETTGDGRKMKTTITLQDDGKKLIQAQQGEVPSTLIRELKDDDTIVMTLEAKGITCTRVYKRAD